MFVKKQESCSVFNCDSGLLGKLKLMRKRTLARTREYKALSSYEKAQLPLVADIQRRLQDVFWQHILIIFGGAAVLSCPLYVLTGKNFYLALMLFLYVAEERMGRWWAYHEYLREQAEAANRAHAVPVTEANVSGGGEMTVD
ncbi:MAG: hypothetical protein JXR94_14060 [Candidatus Hydrogenedentes bacterium]|nr:hypothetical protein [Candidatus Hydrogenedentota bacterium]